MKEESVLTILMYLFKNHMQNSCELDTSQTHLSSKLEELGFHRKTIDQAFAWLDSLTKGEKEDIQTPSQQSLRVFNQQECELLNMECRRLLFTMEQQGIINPQTRELIINQVLELEQEGIDVPLLKWVTLIILFNRPRTDQYSETYTFNCLKFLLLEDTIGGVH